MNARFMTITYLYSEKLSYKVNKEFFYKVLQLTLTSIVYI